jgi:hypothetical protein
MGIDGAGSALFRQDGALARQAAVDVMATTASGAAPSTLFGAATAVGTGTAAAWQTAHADDSSSLQACTHQAHLKIVVSLRPRFDPIRVGTLCRTLSVYPILTAFKGVVQSLSMIEPSQLKLILDCFV